MTVRDAWGVRNDKLPVDELRSGLIAIGWDGMVEDLRGLSREDIADQITSAWPEANALAVGGTVGQLFRFANEISIGDLVLAPVRATRRVDIGRVASDYYFEPEAEVHRHRREVEWLATDLPRRALPPRAQTALRSQLTVFHVKGAGELEPLVASPQDTLSHSEIRELLVEAAALVESEAGVDPAAYAEIAQAPDPVARLRVLVHAGSASPTFVQLAGAQRVDLSLEALVVRMGHRIGLSQADVDQAKARIDFWLA